MCNSLLILSILLVYTQHRLLNIFVRFPKVVVLLGSLMWPYKTSCEVDGGCHTNLSMLWAGIAATFPTFLGPS